MINITKIFKTPKMKMPHSRKIDLWKGSDFVRIIFFFVLHTVILWALFLLGGLVNVDFDVSAFWDKLSSSGMASTVGYGTCAIISMSICVFMYFFFENRNFIKSGKNVNLIYIIFELSIVVNFLTGHYVSVYARPFALCGLLALGLVNRRAAVFMSSIITILTLIFDVFAIGALSRGINAIAPVFIGFTTSLIAVYVALESSGSRMRFLATGAIISLITFVFAAFIEYDTFLSKEFWKIIIYGAFSGMMAVVMDMAALPIFEWTFNLVTDFRLAELSNYNSKLLKKMYEEAPGTFTHCSYVAMLAEQCASAIGENAVLARACALYHDVGKLEQPEFFTENQKSKNLHNEITPEVSVDIIRSHTKNGVKIIKKNRLPQIFADVAEQHHGTMVIRYFYAQAQKFYENDLDAAKFSYPGPKPKTKIAAIIMIADGAEAKARSLKDRSSAAVDQAVKEIIEERVNADQFSDCDLTTFDIAVIRETLTKGITGIHHDRIAYPPLKIGK
ncbi:MAG: HDIG domain-containing protein [Clostridia bacterium]|nr:HDIG domain-containing protein [Clostridia bacterium]